MTPGSDRSSGRSTQSRSTESTHDDQAGAARSAVRRLIDPIRGKLWLACGFQAISAAFGVIPFIALAELGRLLLAEGPVDAERAWWIVIVAAAALAVRLVFLMVAGGITHVADLDLQLELRRRMANRLANAPLGWFTERSAGAVKKALQDDVADLHHLVGHAYVNGVAALVTPIVALGYLLWIDWRLALAALVPLALGLGLYLLQYRGYGEKIGAYQESLEGVNRSAVEFVQGIAVVKTFGQARQAFARFVERTNAFTAYFWNWMRGLVAVSSASEIVLSPLFSLFAVLAAGLVLVATGHAEPVDVIAAAILAPALTAPILTLSYAQNDMMLARDAAERIGEVLDTPVLAVPSVPRTPLGARVTFDDVWFSFDGETNVFHGVDLILEPGTLTALVGPSGSGKSTLASLVPRFWDPTRGEVAVGGVSVSRMTPEALYASVSFVFQTVQLLRGTIAENIAMGRPDASMEEIRAAAKRAHIHDTLLSLPEGYDTLVGAGAQLSGGEAQRVSLARALLADCPVLVLDEATAFLDPEAEASVQAALSDLMADRTVLVIAHRLHTITNVDQICVLDEGRIVERGRHADLLALNGLYGRLWTASEVALKSNAAGAKS